MIIKIIIVDDDPMVADLNKAYVESIEGFKVEKILNNGEDALKYLETNNVDLILLDVYMPRLSGIKLLEEMRKRSILTDVILVTAARESHHIDEVLKLGAFDYLIKPFEYERIKKSLETYLLRHKLLENKQTFKQEDVDQITSKSFKVTTNSLQKGLHQKTLDRICKFMEDHSERFYSSEEVADETRLSRVTIRKYLDYLVSIDKIVTEIEYKAVGRPGNLYKYNSK
jgi:response regulator of citrate/malate metabolism